MLRFCAADTVGANEGGSQQPTRNVNTIANNLDSFTKNLNLKTLTLSLARDGYRTKIHVPLFD